jgi:ectoine hydroxylase-related dioxygenase (phytanoyl-CoA dioxygenase family)
MSLEDVSLPNLSEEFLLDAEQAPAFQRDGHILLRGVATPGEVGKFRPVILAARDRHGPEVTPLEQRDSYGKAFLKGMNLWTVDEGVRRFVLSRRFAKIAADLMGVKGVRIYHDQALLKESVGGITPWHQDQHYWPLDTVHTVTMWMPLVDVTPEMGTLRFVTGSQHQGYLGDLPISNESEAKLDAFIRARGFAVVQCPAMKAGDATFHSGWTVHGAPGNSTDRTREVMTIIWFADGTRVTVPDNPNRARDLERWLPGLKPGDVAASKLNPLAFGTSTPSDGFLSRAQTVL